MSLQETSSKVWHQNFRGQESPEGAVAVAALNAQRTGMMNEDLR